MDLPIKTFWLMDGNINRISAQEDERKLKVATFSQGEPNTLMEALRETVGDVMKFEFDPVGNAVRDERGIQELRQL